MFEICAIFRKRSTGAVIIMEFNILYPYIIKEDIGSTPRACLIDPQCEGIKYRGLLRGF